MLIAAIIVGVIALILSIYFLLDGIIIMLSRNLIRKGFVSIGYAVLCGLLTAAVGIFILSNFVV